MKKLLCITFLALSSLSFAQRNGVIFLVRHGERNSSGMSAAAMNAEPLNAKGEQRAKCLAETLGNAGITQIYVTDIKRTQQTAAPLANELHLQPRILPKASSGELVKDLKSGTGNALVVGHADTLPTIIQQLGAGTVPAFADQDYDRLLIVPMVDGKAQALTTIKYCSAN